MRNSEIGRISDVGLHKNKNVENSRFSQGKIYQECAWRNPGKQKGGKNGKSGSESHGRTDGGRDHCNGINGD